MRHAGVVACALIAACSHHPREESAPAKAPPPAKPAAPPTYWNRVAAILERNCISCHAAGGIAPFELGTYDEARAHAQDIAHTTREREMPPWLPDTQACAPLRHSRALAEEDIDAIDAWVKSGAPEGRRDDYVPPPPRRSFEVVADPPDRSVFADAPYVPKRDRADDYHCFVLDPKLDDTKNVTALRVQPGAGALVHHVILYEVRKSALERVRERDEAEPGPGYTCFGGIGVQPTIRAGDLSKGELVDFDAQMIVAWAPGAGATDVAGSPTALPRGTAIRVAAGSKLVLQVHYSLDNFKPGMSDRTRVDLWFGKSDAQRQAVWVPLAKWDFRVPAGVGPEDLRARAHTEIELPFPLTVLGVAGHMHLRGRALKVDAVDPARCLLDIPRWDFHHQEAYWLEEGAPIRHAGLTCQWDNRPEAQPLAAGKKKKARELRWGEGTDDEMCLAFLYATL